MQSSCDALLHRRAFEKATLGKKQLCEISLSVSVFLISWALLFLLSSFASQGYGDGIGELSGEPTRKEVKSGQVSSSENMAAESCPVSSSENMIAESSQVSSSENMASKSSQASYENFIIREEFETDAHDLSAHMQGNETNNYNHEPVVKEEKANISMPIEKQQVVEEISDAEVKSEKKIPLKSDKLPRIVSSLDEFKSKALKAKEKFGACQTGDVKNRVEPGGKEYNYASVSKGAKVLSFNKEAKGAYNILDKDKDKYLRNPCSVDDKHVIIQLSEETLVATIEIANFEHYASNLKDFELLSSLVYPTNNWSAIGNFTAANAKHAQRFVIQEPKWARYLKLNLMSHYGSEFYCTLSMLQVYGVDAIEMMLEDLISVKDSRFVAEEPTPEQPSLLKTTEDDLYNELVSEIYHDPGKVSTDEQLKVSKNKGVAAGSELQAPQAGRMPGDTVLKILMQKVRFLDVNSAVLERYLEDLNIRYGKLFRDNEKELSDKDLLIQQLQSEIRSLENSRDVFREDIGGLHTWKSKVSSQVERLVQDNTALRLEVEKVRADQTDLENRSLAVVLISFGFGCFAAMVLASDLLVSVCRMRKPENFGRTSGWFLLLLSSSIVTFIIVL